MLKIELTCNCGASFKAKLGPEEYRDYNYGLRQQTDRWLETHNAHDPYTPAITYPVSPTVDEPETSNDEMASVLDT